MHNKIDLSGETAHIDRRAAAQIHVHLCARNGAGLDLLRSELARLAGRGEGTQGAFSARTRHVQALQETAAHLQAAQVHLQNRVGELAAEELRQAQRTLGEITGRYTSDDLLGAIFSSFCIGK